MISKPLLIALDHADQLTARPDVFASETATPIRAEVGEGSGYAVPYQVVDGIAVLPVSGTLVSATGYLTSVGGYQGYDGVRAMLAMANEDDDVEDIMMVLDTPGGDVIGLKAVVSDIERSMKPVYSYTPSMAASAGYWIGSAAKRMGADDMAMVGSIGAVAVVQNVSGNLAQNGITVEYIRSGRRKAEVNSVEPMTDEARSMMQRSVERAGTMFANAVAKNRKMSVEDVLSTEAALLDPEQALTLGLIDEVGSLEEMMNSIRNERAMSQSQLQETPMEIQTNDEAIAQGAASERARIKAILDTGHPGAQHMAFNTSMSANDAIGLLAAIPASAPVAAPVAATVVSNPIQALEAHAVVRPDVAPTKQITTRDITTSDGRFSIGAAVAAMNKTQ